MPFVTSSDGVRIFYKTDGQGEPLVLSHGGTHTWETWQDLGYTDELKDRFQLILIDSRGHGKSDRPHDVAAYTIPQHVDDVVAVVDGLDINRFHFWGYSYGAQIGLQLARRIPERVQSVIAYGDHPYARSHEDVAFADEMNATLRQGMQAWVDQMESAGVFASYPEPATRRKRLLAADPDALIALNLACVSDPGIGEDLPRISLPILLIAGEYDPVNELAHRAAGELPSADFVSVGGIRHSMVHAQTILPYVRAFWARHRLWPVETKP